MAEEVAGEGTTQTPEATLLTDAATPPPETPEVTAEVTPTETEATAEAEPKSEVPEAYDLKAPEGTTLDPDVLAVYAPVFKEAGLTNEVAQKLMDVHIEQQQKALVAQHSTWVSTVKSDPEIGGKQFDTTVKHAQAALARFGSPELKSILETTGLGSHPELVRVFAKIGAAQGEDVIVTGSASTPALNPAKVMFPSMN